MSSLVQRTAFLEAHLFAPTTTVVLPSNGATLSASQYLDATASPGLSAVKYELSGQGLTKCGHCDRHTHCLWVVGGLEHDGRA